MDMILEIIVEVILEGALDASTDRRVPLPVRILLAVILIGLYAGICGLLIYFGIGHNEPFIAVVGVLLFLLVGIAVWMKYREMKKKRR